MILFLVGVALVLLGNALSLLDSMVEGKPLTNPFAMALTTVLSLAGAAYGGYLLVLRKRQRRVVV